MKTILTTVLFALTLSALCLAQSGPRHLDFTQPLMGVDGKPLTVGEAKAGAPVPAISLSDVAVNALEGQTQADAQMAGTEKFKLDQLARKIFHQKDVVLTVEEIALIKDRIGKGYPPAIVGAAWPLLDPAEISAK